MRTEIINLLDFNAWETSPDYLGYYTIIDPESGHIVLTTDSYREALEQQERYGYSIQY